MVTADVGIQLLLGRLPALTFTQALGEVYF